MLFDVGDQVRSTVTFATTAVPPVNTDPSTIAVTIDPPGTGLVSYTYPATIVKDSTGVYHVDFTLTGPSGRWTITWVGTGLLVATAVTTFLAA